MSKNIRFVGALLGYLGAAISGIAYIIYGAYLLGGTNTNVITWALWSFEAVLAFLIYKKQTRDDFATYAEELVASIGCGTITVILIAKTVFNNADLFGQVAVVDWIIAALFVAVFAIYRTSLKRGDVWPATLMFQVALVFSALPLMRSAYGSSSTEPIVPWVLWSVGFFLQFLCAFFRREGNNGSRTLLTPGNYCVLHAVITVIIFSNAAP